MDIREKMHAYDSETDEVKVARLIEDFTRSYVDFFTNINSIESPRKVALALNRMTVHQNIVDYINAHSDILDMIHDMLENEDVKVRKNLYTTLAHIGANTSELEGYLVREESYINIYHIMTILSKRNDVDLSLMKSVLGNIDPCDSYHAKIASLIDNISLTNTSPLILSHVPEGDRLLLTAPTIASNVIQHDAQHYGIDVIDNNDIGCVVDGVSLGQVMNVRSFYEMLIIPHGILMIDRDIDAIAAHINTLFSVEYFNALFGVCRERYSYRLEIRGDISNAERTAMTHSVVKQLDNTHFVNIRDRYDIEIRVYWTNKGASIALKVPYIDKRFDYRREQLPASIHPVTASIIAGIIEAYIAEHGIVMDAFVGTGTMLYELYSRIGDAEYVGVDIEKNAIAKAQSNLLGKIPRLELVHSDILKYTPTKQANVIISNMPFGTRVLRHDAITKLYTSFFAQLDTYLAPRGTCCLLTTNGKALREAMHGTKHHIIKEYRVPSGGLLPYLFIIR